MIKNSAKKGFTLVELLVVIAIVAVLATVSIIGYTSFIKKAHMSNDTALANQVNTLLSGHRVYEKVDDEQSIAKVLKNGKIASDVKIESQKYDMDIFYNESKEKFELMSNQEGTSQQYKTLHYYLNLEESEDIPITPPQEPEVEENPITFYVNEAYNKLWEDILYVTRVNEDPIKEWEKHNKYLKEKCNKLNDYDFASLHFKSKNGTDLVVELQENQQFAAGSETSLQNITFNPNMPSEECFGMPSKYGVNGVVYSTKPLSYNGELIEDFSIRFEKGKAVEVHAKVGEDLLKKMISMDEGSAYLGEVALVPYNSPISNSNILFYNTLYDENASCHLALGRAYTCNIKGYENMTLADFKKLGINDSLNHVDFMVGAKDTNIVGILKDGSKIQVFKDGNWAI
jgi:prepilin-type N-terminal cleavage/methylation domain-containing protein